MTVHIHSSDHTDLGAGAKFIVVPDLDDLAWDGSDAFISEVKRRNDRLAVSQNGGADRRFGLLPFPAVEESQEEAMRVLDDLGLDGVVVVPAAAEKRLDDDVFTPLLRLLSEKDAYLLLHPIRSNAAPLTENGLDPVLAIARLLYRDRLRAATNVRFAIAHDHGVTAFLADNLGMLYYLQEKRMRIVRFLVDYAVRKRLRGVELVRSIEVCA